LETKSLVRPNHCLQGAVKVQEGAAYLVVFLS